ncbi:MAG TPA: aminopeptidase P family protein, partial [Anaerolineae bacterium]|nr:aminopeptidase P family protein [Anaerolineae bacterium]
MNNARLQKLSKKLIANKLDWLALVPSPSFIYLSGIHSHVSERPVVLFVGANGQVGIIIPTLEAMKAEAVGISAENIFAWSDQAGYHDAFAQAAIKLKLANTRIGVEALKMRVLESDLLSEIAHAQVAHADAVMDSLRLRKDADEIAAIQHAVNVAEAAMTAFLPSIKIGMTEKALAAKLTQAMLDAGADDVTFASIVSAGPNTASPHAVPTNRPIQSGELLILDWGARVGDYVSDITRTYALGEISDTLRNIYAIVQASNAAGVAACRPNITGAEIDKAARDV